jgi:hypothetical protein
MLWVTRVVQQAYCHSIACCLYEGLEALVLVVSGATLYCPIQVHHKLYCQPKAGVQETQPGFGAQPLLMEIRQQQIVY